MNPDKEIGYLLEFADESLKEVEIRDKPVNVLTGRRKGAWLSHPPAALPARKSKAFATLSVYLAIWMHLIGSRFQSVKRVNFN